MGGDVRLCLACRGCSAEQPASSRIRDLNRLRRFRSVSHDVHEFEERRSVHGFGEDVRNHEVSADKAAREHEAHHCPFDEDGRSLESLQFETVP